MLSVAATNLALRRPSASVRPFAALRLPPITYISRAPPPRAVPAAPAAPPGAAAAPACHVPPAADAAAPPRPRAPPPPRLPVRQPSRPVRFLFPAACSGRSRTAPGANQPFTSGCSSSHHTARPLPPTTFLRRTPPANAALAARSIAPVTTSTSQHAPASCCPCAAATARHVTSRPRTAAARPHAARRTPPQAASRRLRPACCPSPPPPGPGPTRKVVRHVVPHLHAQLPALHNTQRQRLQHCHGRRPRSMATASTAAGRQAATWLRSIAVHVVTLPQLRHQRCRACCARTSTSGGDETASSPTRPRTSCWARSATVTAILVPQRCLRLRLAAAALACRPECTTHAPALPWSHASTSRAMEAGAVGGAVRPMPYCTGVELDGAKARSCRWTAAGLWPSCGSHLRPHHPRTLPPPPSLPRLPPLPKTLGVSAKPSAGPVALCAQQSTRWESWRRMRGRRTGASPAYARCCSCL